MTDCVNSRPGHAPFGNPRWSPMDLPPLAPRSAAVRARACVRARARDRARAFVRVRVRRFVRACHVVGVGKYRTTEAHPPGPARQWRPVQDRCGGGGAGRGGTVPLVRGAPTGSGPAHPPGPRVTPRATNSTDWPMRMLRRSLPTGASGFWTK